MTKETLEKLAAESSENTSEIFTPNDYYGHAYLLKKYCGINQEFSLPGIYPHAISFRDKAIKYPKIILGTEHPPLQESNCPELEFVLTKAKIFRDSIVHASPSFHISDFVPKKENILYELTIEDVEAIVDNTIELVKKIEIIICNNHDRLRHH